MNFYEILLIRGRYEEEIEKKLLRIAVESHDYGEEITVNDFFSSMNIHTTLLDNFHRQPLSSLLNNIINEGKKEQDCVIGIFDKIFAFLFQK